MGEQLRLLMRASAQPVAIITAFLPPPKVERPSAGASAFLAPKRIYPSHGAHADDGRERTLVHGATLSSYSSVSLDPPRVAFSLRIPSRLADALLHDALAYAFPRPASRTAPEPHFVINLLSSQQADIARTYAHPGLAPYDVARKSLAEANSPSPSLSSSSDASGESEKTDENIHPLDLNAIAFSEYAHPAHSSQETKGEGVPFLVDAVGALACRIIRVVDLADSPVVETRAIPDQSLETRLRARARLPGTFLFIAEVCGVERTRQPLRAMDHYPPQSRRKPLLYCNRAFVSVDDEAL